MADKDIKQRIVLEGEKEYNAALSEARRNLKVLRSELKAETAELGKNATAQDKNAVKVKNLQKQISQQEKVVKTYEKALEEVREKYGDNEEAISKWEIKLNDARTALANMRNSIEDTSRSMQGIGTSAEMGVVAANSLADSLGKVAEVGGTISDALEEAFKNIVGKIKDTVTEVWESVVDLAARSNNLVDLAGFWNTTPTNIQKWVNAASHASAGLEDIAGLVTKINSVDGKKIAELTGVSGENYQDRWEYAMAVVDAMSQMSTEARNAAGFEIFGRQATKMFDLANDWATVKAHLAENDVEQGGYGLTEKQLSDMSTLYDKVNGLKQSWQSLKDMATVELFGDLALNVTGNLQNIVDAFKEYFQAEDDAGREAAIQKIKENIIQIFENIRDAVDEGLKLLDDLAEQLKGSDDATARALGEILERLVSAFQWFADPGNWESVKAGFEALIGVWAVGNISKAVGNIAAFAAHAGTIWSFFGGKGGSPTGTPTAAPSANSNATTTAAASGGFFAGILKTAIPILTGAGLVIYDSLSNHASNDIDEKQFIQMAREGDTYAKSLTDKLSERFGMSLEELEAEGRINQVMAQGWTSDEELFDRLENEYGWTPVQRTAYHDSGKFALTDEQRRAAEAYWDAYKLGGSEEDSLDKMDAAWDALEETFGGDESAFDQLVDEMERLLDQIEGEGRNGKDLEDLPADWWKNQNTLTSDDISGFRSLPGLMGRAVQNGVSGIRVTLDGSTVGRLVAPYVSEMIARDIFM